ncbi:VonWillebr and factor type A domain-containing protein [Haloferula helveola]|uniref:vonWillebr and factor type A domain-containing protein n=1 Tax=Haloferula helveola TaxID=490095 RepID=A0ABN6H2H5_9BACT|nr:VonWillebr and factor type A domain-containing protein [Haloferula helveola]
MRFARILVAAAALLLPATALAQLQVSVMPSYSQNTSYANAEINQPIQVWGRAWGGTPPYTYSLSFGDGTPDAGGAVGNPDDIGAAHSYTTAGLKTFTLTVTDAASASVSRSGTIRVFGSPTKDQLVNMAIEKGLRFLYLNQHPAGPDQCLWQGSNNNSTRNEYTVGSTGAAVLAFEENGHLPGNDPVQDIYAPTVDCGLNWLTNFATTYPISVQTAGDPDSNGNGVGVYFWAGGHETYSNCLAGLALIASETSAADAQARTIPAGPLAGTSYYDAIQDFLDLLAFSQTDGGTSGGWVYSIRTSNSGGNDGSAMQWPALVSRAAEDLWGLSTPAWVKERNAGAYRTLQNASGGVGYRSNVQWLNAVKTGGALVALQVAGYDTSDPDVQQGINYIGSVWANDSGSGTFFNNGGTFGQWYGMYGVKKGLQLQGVSTLNTSAGPRDWQSDYDCWLLGDASGLDPSASPSRRNTNSMFGQLANGSWLSTTQWPGTSVSDAEIATAHGVLILTRSVTVALPVAVIADCGEVSTKPGQRAFQMDGTGSFHSDPDLSIQEYRWDFDASDGVDFDNPDAVGAIVTNPGYSVVGNYTISLQVRDNSDPQRVGQTSEVCAAVDTDIAPIAVAIPAGRPSYNCRVGEEITLDGSESFDPDGDEITLFEWDLDGDGQFDDATGQTPTFSCDTEGAVAVRLRVTALGKTGVSQEVILVASPNDLAVASLSASDIDPGVSADVTVGISNDPASGNGFTDVLVRFYNGNPLTGGAQLGGNYLVDIPAGATVSLTADDLPLGGTELVWVYIDANLQVPEYEEDNNIDAVNVTNQPPIAVAQDLIVPANANCEGIASASDFDGGSSDPDGDPLTLSIAPAGPYPLGVTPVTLTVTDPLGESDTDTATITVVDATPPVLTLNGAADVTLECGVDSYTELGAGVTDNCDAGVSVVIGGDAVADTPGVYVVTYDATDASGNAATQLVRTVTVVDTTPPVITCPGDMEVPTLGPLGVVVNFSVTATDACDPAPVIVCTPASGTVFPVGETLVTCTAIDAAGLEDTCTFTVKVLSAEELLCALIECVEQMDIHHGIKNALLAKLRNSKSSLRRGRMNAAINQLEAFMSHVESQRGKKLTDEQADHLLAKAAVVHAAMTGVPYGDPYLATIDLPPGFQMYLGAGVVQGKLMIYPEQVEGLGGSSTLLQLVWNGLGVLESAEDPSGPWEEVEIADPPYWHAVTPEEPVKFFRVNQP